MSCYFCHFGLVEAHFCQKIKITQFFSQKFKITHSEAHFIKKLRHEALPQVKTPCWSYYHYTYMYIHGLPL